MKKGIILLLLCFTASLVACKAKPEPQIDTIYLDSESIEDMSTEAGVSEVISSEIIVEDTENVYRFPVGFETYLTLGMSIDDVVALLGEPSDEFEAPDCAIDDKVVVYNYNDYELDFAYNSDGSKLISISFLDDIPMTEEGLCIGNTREQVGSIYGEQNPEENEYIYKKGNTELHFIFDGQVISYIEYKLNLNS